MAFFRSFLAAFSVVLASAGGALALDANIVFAPSQLAPHQVGRMSLNLTNPAASKVEDVSFAKDFPGIFVAPTANLATSCTGTAPVVGNGSEGGTLRLEGLEVPSNLVDNGTCQVSFDVVTYTKGSRTVEILAGEVSGTVNGTTVSNPQRSAVTLVTAVKNPSVVLRHLDGRYLSQGEQARIGLRITNDAPSPLTDLGARLPSATLLSAGAAAHLSLVPGSFASSCGGTGVVSAEGFSFDGAVLPAGQVCDVEFAVAAARDPNLPRSQTNLVLTLPVGAVFSAEGATNDTEDRLIATVSSGVAVDVLFNGQRTAAQNISITPLVRLKLAMENHNTTPAGQASLTDNLPAGMVVESIVSNSCGGTVSGVGSGALAWSGQLGVAPTQTRSSAEFYGCAIEADVRVAAAGSYTNTIPAGALAGQAYAQASATLNASAGTLGAAMTLRGAGGVGDIYWGDSLFVGLTLHELSGEASASEVRVPVRLGLSNGVKFHSVASDSCTGGTVSVVRGTGKASDGVAYTAGSLGPGQSCVAVLRYQTLPDTLSNFRINTDAFVDAGTITYKVGGNPVTFSQGLQGGFGRITTPFQTTVAFVPAEIGAGGVARQRATISFSSVDRTPAREIFMRVPLTGGLLVADAGTPTSSCGGSVNAVPGAAEWTFAGGHVSAAAADTQTCVVEVPVRAPALAPNTTQASASSVVGTDAIDSSVTNFRAFLDTPALAADHQDAYNGRNTPGTLSWSQRSVQVSKAFSPAVVDGGVPSRVSITINNTAANAIRLTDVYIPDDMTGTDLRLSSSPDALLLGCTGSIQAPPHSQVALLRNAVIEANRSCVFSFNVMSPTGGNHINTLPAGTITSAEAVTNASAASATLTVLRSVNVSPSFDRKVIVEGQVADLFLDFTNTNTFAVYGQPDVLSVALPSGLSADGGVVSGCAGMDARMESNTLKASGGTFAPGEICQVRVPVRALSAGAQEVAVEAGSVRTRTQDGTEMANSSRTSASLVVVAPPVVRLETFDFRGDARGSFYPGERGVLRATVEEDASDHAYALMDVRGRLSLDILGVVEPLDVFSTCGANISQTADGLAYEMAALPCTISVGFEAHSSGEAHVAGSGATAHAVSGRDGHVALDPVEGEAPTPATLVVSESMTLGVELGAGAAVEWDVVPYVATITNSVQGSGVFDRLTTAFGPGLSVMSVDTSACPAVQVLQQDANGWAVTLAAGARLEAGQSCAVTGEVHVQAAGVLAMDSDLGYGASGAPSAAARATLDVVAAAPAFSATSAPDPVRVEAAGTQVRWTVRVENTGNSGLLPGQNQVRVGTHAGPVLVDLEGSLEEIKAGEGRDFTALYTATQEDIDGLEVLEMSAAIEMVGPNAQALPTQPVQSSIAIEKAGAIDVAKALRVGSLPSHAIVGDVAIWDVRLANTGNLSYTDLSWSDSGMGAIAGVDMSALDDGLFAPGEVVVVRIEQALTQDDIDAARVGGRFVVRAAHATQGPYEAGLDAQAPITVNTAPQALDDAVAGGTPGSVVEFAPAVNDTDDDGNLDRAAVALWAGTPAAQQDSWDVEGEGVYTVLADGRIRFSPQAGSYANPTPVEYVVRDTRGAASAPARIAITYDPIVAPQAVDDSLADNTTTQPVRIAVLDNDVAMTLPLDPASLRVEGQTSVVVPEQGTWSVQDGDVVFTPTLGFTGNPTPVAYTVADVSGLSSAPAQIRLTFAPRPPVAADDAPGDLATGTVVRVDVLANDSDPDGVLDAASVALVGADADGTVVVAGEGVWSVDGGTVLFAPAAGFTANPQPVSYTVADNDGNRSNPAKVALAFMPRPPVAADDRIEGLETGGAVVVDVLSNDRDLDGAIVPASVVLVSAPAEGKELVVEGEGRWTVLVDGRVRFAPKAGFTANPGPVSYTVADNDANRSNPAAITLIFTPRSPVAVADTVGLLKTGARVEIEVLANDVDPDGALDMSSVQLVGAPAPGTVLDVPGEGVWSVLENGRVAFEPAPGVTADPSPVFYTVADNDANVSAPAPIALQFVPEMPVAQDDVRRGVESTTEVRIDVLANDGDPDGSLDVLSVELVGGADPKRLEEPGVGVWAVSATGEVVFTPAPGATASPATIFYTVADNDANRSNAARIELVYAVEVPVAVDDVAKDLLTGSAHEVDVLANDADPDGSLDAQSVRLVEAADGLRVEVVGEGVWDVVAGARVRFTPNSGFTANPTPIHYTVADNDANVSNAASITLRFMPRPPMAADDALGGLATGTVVRVDVLANDSDPDGALDAASVALVGADADGAVVVPGEGVWSVDNGTVVFAPAAGFTANPAPVSYTVADNDGNRSNPAVVALAFVARPPVALDDALGDLATATVVRVDVLANDSDPDGALDAASVALMGADVDGTIVVAGEGVWSVENGSVVFAPAAGFTANPAPVSYTVADNDGNLSNPATVVLAFVRVAPVARPDRVADAPAGVPVLVDVLANDSDADGRIDPASVSLVDAPAPHKRLDVAGEGRWEVTDAGMVRFVPADGLRGDPSPVRYVVADNDGNVSQPVSVHVTFARAAPVARPDVVEGVEAGGMVVVDVLANDTPGNGALDGASVQLVGGVDGLAAVDGVGAWRVLADGQVRFEPESAAVSGTVSIGYTVADNWGTRSTQAVITLHISPVVVGAPLARADRVDALGDGQPVEVDVLANDEATDAPLDPQTLVLVGPAGPVRRLMVADEGVWSVLASGQVRFVPAPDVWTSPAPVRYQVANAAGGLSNEATITVVLNPAAGPVVEADRAGGFVPGAPAVVDVLANDAAGVWALDVYSVQIAGAGADGRLVVEEEGVWSVQEEGQVAFAPLATFFGDPSPIRYTVADVAGVRSAPVDVVVDYDQNPEMEARIEVVDVVDVHRNGITDPGDRVSYRVWLTNTGNIPVLGVDAHGVGRQAELSCVPMDVSVGATVALECAHAQVVVDQADAQAGRLVLDITLVGASLEGQVLAQADVMVEVVATPVARPLRVGVEKVVESGESAVVGQNVPYLITVRNADKEAAAVVDVIDRLPAGLSYVPASARMGREKVRVDASGTDVVFNDITIPAGGVVQLRLQAAVVDFEAGVRNVVLVTRFDDRSDVVASSAATVAQSPEGVAVFECAAILGRVFEDTNGNAWMDEGERGIGGVRIITARGSSIVTDAHGRYSVPCADAPAEMGSNTVVKLDPRSLPEGMEVGSENPKIVRLHPGKSADASFAVRPAARQDSTPAHLVEVGVDAQAFVSGQPSADLRAALQGAAGPGVKFVVVYHKNPTETRAQALSNAQALSIFVHGLQSLGASVSVQY